MVKFRTFPHHNVEIKDESIRNVFRPEVVPIHRPMFLGFAEKGDIGVPKFGNYTQHSNHYGKGTFDQYSKFFYHPNLFLTKACNYQQCFFVRLADSAAEVASAVLELHLTENADIPQYQKDGDGYRMVDGSDDWIPVEESGSPVTETGVEIFWTLRPLGVDESLSNLLPETTGDVTVYPIMAFEASSPNSAANKAGVKLWFDWSTADLSIINNIEALMFEFGIVDQPYGLDTPMPVRNLFGNPTTAFSFKEDAIDSATDRRVYFDYILQNDYTELPFNIKVFSEHIETIGDKILLLETMEELTNAYMVNVFNGKSLEGKYYDHVLVKSEVVAEPTVTVLDEDVIQYMSGGNDGDTTNASLESLTAAWVTGNVFPDIYDQARYPVTHLYDSGYELDTKKAMIDFLGVRDDVKVVLSTQEVANTVNSKEEDQSTGSALRAQLLLHPESLIHGTQVCRGTIFQQCGRLVENPNWLEVVPATYDCLTKKCRWQGATYFKGKPKGLPNSAVEVLKNINWFPNSDDHKQLSWDTGLNYMQYYDMSRYHYPDVRSIYPYETSLISDDIMCDILVYLKHIARYHWSVFAGRDEDAELLFGEIKKDISDDIFDKFGNFLKFEVSVYQTDIDKLLGYQSTVEIAVYGNMPQRVWNVIIPVRRNEE